VEIKSGYGLDPDSEDRMLDAIRIVGERQPMEVIPTFLGAHEIPDDRRDDRQGYIREIMEEQMPRVRGKAVFCDVFCEEGVFTPEESRRILLAGKRNGFRPKVHAEEFAPTGGAEVAVEVGAASADHLEAISEDGIRALAGSDTIGVLLPGVSFYLGMERKAPAREMIERGVAVAIATDGNPGSSVTDSMQIILTLACVHLRMTPYEALAAATRNAAYAVGAEGRAGVLEAGRPADIVIWDMPSLRAIPHYFGTNLVHQVMKAGTQCELG
jgi:imidazolonepropionase